MSGVFSLGSSDGGDGRSDGSFGYSSFDSRNGSLGGSVSLGDGDFEIDAAAAGQSSESPASIGAETLNDPTNLSSPTDSPPIISSPQPTHSLRLPTIGTCQDRETGPVARHCSLCEQFCDECLVAHLPCGREHGGVPISVKRNPDQDKEIAGGEATPEAEEQDVNQSFSDAEMRPRRPACGYRVVMVTTKPVHTFGPISDRLYTVPEPATEIRWNSTSVPTATPILTFRRHFALCLIPQDIWARDDKSLEWKFEGQRFWDYRGNLQSSSRASMWDQRSIRGITTMQDLGAVSGATTALDECSRVYDRLATHWGEYFPVWWNSSDFAIVLALLLVGNSAATECRRLMNHLALLRKVEILVPRGTGTWLSACTGALALTAGTGTWLSVCTGTLALTGTAGLAVPAIAAAAVISSGILSFAEKARLKKRLKACARLTTLFPALTPLFAE